MPHIYIVYSYTHLLHKYIKINDLVIIYILEGANLWLGSWWGDSSVGQSWWGDSSVGNSGGAILHLIQCIDKENVHLDKYK